MEHCSEALKPYKDCCNASYETYDFSENSTLYSSLLEEKENLLPIVSHGGLPEIAQAGQAVSEGVKLLKLAELWLRVSRC